MVKALKAGEATLPVPTAASQESRFGMACAMPPDVEVSHLAAEIENRLKGSAEYSNIRSRRGSPYSPAEITIEADIGSAQMPFARSTTAITQDSSAVTLIHVIEGSFAQYVYAAPTGDLLPENLVKGLREYLDQIVGKDKVKCGPFEQGLVRRVLSPMHPLQRY